MDFSTKDNDNDKHGNHADHGNCSKEYGGGGGWWFNNCFAANLNGRNKKGARNWRGIVWAYKGKNGMCCNESSQFTKKSWKASKMEIIKY